MEDRLVPITHWGKTKSTFSCSSAVRRKSSDVVDSGFLLAGALAAAAYFDTDTAMEREIRELADALYRRCDSAWARNGKATVTHTWRPENGVHRKRTKPDLSKLARGAACVGSSPSSVIIICKRVRQRIAINHSYRVGTSGLATRYRGTAHKLT